MRLSVNTGRFFVEYCAISAKFEVFRGIKDFEDVNLPKHGGKETGGAVGFKKTPFKKELKRDLKGEGGRERGER